MTVIKTSFWLKTRAVPLGLAFILLIFLICATAFNDLFGVRFSLFNTLSAAMFSLSFVLLICAIIVHFHLSQRHGRAFAEASLLENLLLPNPKPALINDLPGCVILANDIARQQFASLSAPMMRIATFLQDTVIDAGACIARMIQTARDKKEICSYLVDGPTANFVSVQPIGPKFLLWRVQEKDQPPKVCDKIFESLLPVLFVDPSRHRLISANAAATKILPPNIELLNGFFETN